MKELIVSVKLFMRMGTEKEKGDYIIKNGDVYTGKVYAQIKMTWMGAETKIEEYIWVYHSAVLVLVTLVL